MRMAPLRVERAVGGKREEPRLTEEEVPEAGKLDSIEEAAVVGTAEKP